MRADDGARRRLEGGAARRLGALRAQLGRSRCPADAAALSAHLDRLTAAGGPRSGGEYLALCRELRGVWRALLRAESQRLEGARRGRAALDEVRAYLLSLRPGLARPLGVLLPEVPLDGDAAPRLRALRALLEARQDIVPHLAAARPRWKR